MTALASDPPETWHRTDPKGIVARGVGSLQKMALPLAAAAIGTGAWREANLAVAATVAAILVLTAGFSWLAWRHHRYAIGSDDFRVERGLLNKTLRAVPYDRIQDVSLHEGPVARLLGLVEVRFDTGAGGKEEVRLAYVSRAQGEALRQTVRARKAGGAAVTVAAPTATAESGESRLLFRMGPRRLVLFGAFEFSLVVFAALFGAVDQLDALLPFNIWDGRSWWQLLEGPGHVLVQLGLAVQIIGALLALATLATVGLATGIVRTVLRDWGFRLEDTERGLRRRRGLLTRTDTVMPVKRVQALTITTGFLRRCLGGWHGLEAISLAQDEKSTSHAIAPFATLAEIAAIAPATGFALPGADLAWHRSSSRFHLDRALLVLVPLVLVTAAVAVLHPLAGLAEYDSRWLVLVPVLAMLGTGLRRWLLWRRDAHAIDSRQLYTRHGWLAPRLTVASRVKLQSVEIAQGPLARRGGYATLRFGLAGGHLAMEGVPLGEATAMRDAVLHSMAGIGFSRLNR